MIFAGGFLVTGNLITNLVMASEGISVLKNFADIAKATYEDSLITAKILKKTITLLFYICSRTSPWNLIMASSKRCLTKIQRNNLTSRK